MPWQDWPEHYLPDNDPTHSPPGPTWPRATVREAGQALVLHLLENPQDAESYRGLAKDGREKNGEHVHDFGQIIAQAYDTSGIPDFNSNDFANIHHIAWLIIGRALCSLTNLNPHGDWGEPPVNGSLHMEPDRLGANVADQRAESADSAATSGTIFFYHYVPNATGYYAVTTQDA